MFWQRCVALSLRIAWRQGVRLIQVPSLRNEDFYYAHRIIRQFSANYDLSVQNPRIQKYIDILIDEYESLQKLDVQESDRPGNLRELRRIYELHSEKMKLYDYVTTLRDLNSEGDKELEKQIEDEKQMYLQKIEELDTALVQEIIPRCVPDSVSSVIMEVAAGVGGQEAMLFAKELFNMYSSYCFYKGWSLDSVESEDSEKGGLRHGTLIISGDCVYKFLKHEAGVHRVQRVPVTEKSGRVHTSTASVIVLPQPDEVDVVLHDKDLHTETKRASGAGGQHVNKTESAVRITHIPTGISVECQTDRSQIKNRKEALRKLRAKLYQLELDEQMAQEKNARKQQVKSNLRSEKIRTYNYNQDRITDHRIGENAHNLPVFLKGEEALDSLIEKLILQDSKEALFQVINERVGK